MRGGGSEEERETDRQTDRQTEQVIRWYEQQKHCAPNVASSCEKNVLGGADGSVSCHP